jgi:hypothetical protein
MTSANKQHGSQAFIVILKTTVDAENAWGLFPSMLSGDVS